MYGKDKPQGIPKKKVGRPTQRGANFKLKTARSMLRKRMDNGKSYVLQQMRTRRNTRFILAMFCFSS